MVSQRELQELGNIESIYPYAASDNDGTFTAGHAIGEIYHYAVLRDKLGEDHPRTKKALKYATMSSEACLLLMYIHGRHEGFIARSYHLPDEPVPDDGLFYVRDGKVARLAETTASKKRGIVGQEVACDYPIPERLARLYRDLGYSDDGIIYKADRLIRDKTILSLLLDRGDFYILPDTMSAYRRFFDDSATNGRYLTNANMELDLFQKAHHVEALNDYFEGRIDYSRQWSDMIWDYGKRALTRAEGFKMSRFMHMYRKADKATKKKVRAFFFESIKRKIG